jgi:cytoskeletal protein CcmA (bactofilin family)
VLRRTKFLPSATTAVTCAFLATVFSALSAAQAADEIVRIGGDVFAGGEAITIDGESAGDVFACGVGVRITAPVSGDIHSCGRTVVIDTEVGGNAYSGGYEVSVAGDLAGNLSVMAYTIDLLASARVAKNVRLAGDSVNVQGDIAGYALLTGTTVVLNGRVEGDVYVEADNLQIGPNARVSGDLHYAARDPIDIQPGVVTAGEVIPEEMTTGLIDLPMGLGTSLVLASLASMLIGGALLLTLFPSFSGRTVTAMDRTSRANRLHWIRCFVASGSGDCCPRDFSGRCFARYRSWIGSAGSDPARHRNGGFFCHHRDLVALARPDR